jgi:hypothetical protein
MRCKLLIVKDGTHGSPLALSLVSNIVGKGLIVNTGEMTGSKNFLIWMGLWIAALMVLLPALAGS